MRGFLAVVENSFWEVLDTRTFWVCGTLSVLFASLLLLMGFEERDVDQQQRVTDALQSLVKQSTKPARVNVKYTGNTDSRRIRIRMPSPAARAAPYLFTPEHIRQAGQYGGLENLQFPDQPQLTVRIGNKRETITIPIETWNKYTIDLNRKRFELLSNPPSFPEELLNQFSSRLIRTYLSGESPSGSSKDAKRDVFVTTRVEFTPNISSAEIPGGTKLSLFFGSISFPLQQYTAKDFIVTVVQNPIINFFVGWVGIIIAIVITSNFIPNMLKEGQVELLLSKTTPRWVILLGRFFGAGLFFMLISAIFLGSSSLFLYLRSGVFTGYLLLSLLPLMLMFFLVYSISVFIGLLFENNTAAMVCAFMGWFLLYSVQTSHTVFETLIDKNAVSGDNQYVRILDFIQNILPAPGEIKALGWKWNMQLGNLSEWMIKVKQSEKFSQIQEVATWNVLGTSIGFILIMLVCSSIVLYRKEV